MGPDSEHDADRDDRGVPGSRSRAGHARAGVDDAHRLFDDLTRIGIATTTSPTRSNARACRSSPTRSTSCSTASARSSASSSRRDLVARHRRARRPHLVARPDRLDGRRRGAVARLARRAGADARTRRRAAHVRERGAAAARLSAWHGRVIARGGDASACSRSSISSCSTRRIRARFAASRRKGRCSSRRPSPGSTIETRSQLDYFLDRGADAVVVTDPGSPLEQLESRVFHGEPTIGRRYSALSMFGMLPRR